jgi:methylthioxylose transferase
MKMGPVVEIGSAEIGSAEIGSGKVGSEPKAEVRELSDRPARTRGWTDPLALTGALALIAVSAVVGQDLLRRGAPIVLPTPPVLAHWYPHVGWGTPLAVVCVLVGLHLQRRAAMLGWRRLLLAGWLLNLAWLSALRSVDGLAKGWTEALLNPNEYLHDLPRITDPAAFLATFTDFIAFGPGVDGSVVWTTHVAAHPPLATLIFWILGQIGLGGGFWAGSLCLLVASTVSVGLPVTLRALGAGASARRVVPFVALFPGAVWMAVSADGLFAGVAVSGLALVCWGAARGRLLASLAGGVLLGATIFLSYGLVLVGVVVVVAIVLNSRQRGLRLTMLPWLIATAGVVGVAAIHLAYGFNWLVGLAQLRVRYYQGIASQRPFSYFVYANVAAWLISCSPLLAVGIVHSIAALRQGRDWTQDRVVATVALSGVAMALLANISALSKAETERIWLTFGVIAGSSLALLRGRSASGALLACGIWALAVKHLLASW